MSDKAIATGGCLCGALRYEVDQPRQFSVNCHCSLCRKATGAPSVAWLSTTADQFRYTQGSPHAYHSSTWAIREFCPHCGTHLTFRMQQDGKDHVDVTVGSLDKPADIPPNYHIFCDAALPWALPNDGLQRFPGAYPGYAPDESPFKA